MKKKKVIEYLDALSDETDRLVGMADALCNREPTEYNKTMRDVLAGITFGLVEAHHILTGDIEPVENVNFHALSLLSDALCVNSFVKKQSEEITDE